METKQMTDMCSENGYDQKTLQKITKNFKKITHNSINNINDNKTDRTQKITLPWVPKIGSKTKKKKKSRVRLAFQAPPNLKNILCRNKNKLISTLECV